MIKGINKKYVLQKLKKGQQIIHDFKNKKREVTFLEYRDFGFTAFVREKSTGKEYLAMGDELFDKL